MPTSTNPSFHPPLPRVNKCSFNQDCSRFSIATSRGFCIYNCNPFREIYRHDSDDGFSVADIINQTTTALVKVGSTDILIWDNLTHRSVHQISLASELLSLYKRSHRHSPPAPREVKAVKPASDNLLLVVTENEIYELCFPKYIRIRHVIPTDLNRTGICSAISQTADASSSVLVSRTCPGEITLERFPARRRKSIETYTNSTDYCFALSADGMLLVEHNGNYVSIFDTISGNILCSLSVGEDAAEICSLVFSLDAKWLAASTDKGEVRVLGLDGILSSSPLTYAVDTMSRTFRSYIKGVLHMKPYVGYVAAHFRLSKDVPSIVSFGRQNNTLSIVGMDGSFYRCGFDPIKGGEMIQLEVHDLTKIKDD